MFLFNDEWVEGFEECLFSVKNKLKDLNLTNSSDVDIQIFVFWLENLHKEINFTKYFVRSIPETSIKEV
jgi:hypothetical protein